MQHGPASHGPAADDTQYLDMAGEEDRAVQNLLANGNNSTPIRLCAIGIGFLALVTMLVARLRRGQSTSILASSGGLGSDVSMNMEPILRDNLMEMNPQGLQMNSAAALETKHPGEETSRRVGWSQLSSQNSEPLTVCYMKQKKTTFEKPLTDLQTKALLGAPVVAAGALAGLFAVGPITDAMNPKAAPKAAAKPETTQKGPSPSLPKFSLPKLEAPAAKPDSSEKGSSPSFQLPKSKSKSTDASQSKAAAKKEKAEAAAEDAAKAKTDAQAKVAAKKEKAEAAAKAKADAKEAAAKAKAEAADAKAAKIV